MNVFIVVIITIAITTAYGCTTYCSHLMTNESDKRIELGKTVSVISKRIYSLPGTICSEKGPVLFFSPSLASRFSYTI